MTRPATSRPAACLAGVLSTGLLAAATGLGVTAPPAAAAAEEPRTPLRVTMDSLTPSAVPRRGEITVTGEVTNRSDGSWRDLQVYLLTSARPIGDSADLAEAAGSDPASEIGQRLATTGLFAEIGDLAPGESTSYALTVDREDLEISGEQGVYWIGVHVLGAGEGSRDAVADGRARSFVPLMERGAPRTRVAVTVPLRQRVNRDATTRLMSIERWQRSLAPGGRLDRLLAFTATSPGPLTWVVDPAVLDAAASVATDNPVLSTENDGSGPPADGDAPPSGGPSPVEESAPAGAAPEAAPPETEDPSLAARQAAAWLGRFRQQAPTVEVRAVPYGDLDVAAATSNRFIDLVRKAHRLSATSMSALGVESGPLLAPPSGYLPGRALSRLDGDVPVLMSDLAMPKAEGPLLTRKSGVDVALVDSSASAGGPGPGNRLSPLAIRQRILAEAALHALSDAADEPLVVSLPPRWNPGGDWQRADFFGGLDVPWLQQAALREVFASRPAPLDTTLPVYPARQRRAQIPFANQVATRELIRTGATFADLLTFNDSVDDELAQAAMLASSYAARDHAARALARARSTSNQVRLTMSQVVIEGPPFVMMSSTTGPIAVTLVNNLAHAVTVRLEAVTGDQLDIKVPETFVLEPGQRTPVRMSADATGIGVRSVTVRATTVEGEPVGTSVRFSVRTSNVGMVIWFVMGGGAVLFLLAIALRIARRVRTRKATPGPLLEGTS